MCRSSRIFVYIFILSLMLSSFLRRAQSLTQPVGGKITEQDSRVLLPGINEVVVGADVFLGGSTNERGEVCIENVPVRRTTLKISYVGYEEKALSNRLITSGKEMVPEMEQREFLISMVGVVITPHQNWSQNANEMALVSAQGFTVEETKRYAGSFNAPTRMVSGYAGVTGDASANSEKVFRYLC